MAFSLSDMLRYLQGGKAKKKAVFKTEREAYEFCRKAYNDTGGVTPELRRAFEFYQKNVDDECERNVRVPGSASIPTSL